MVLMTLAQRYIEVHAPVVRLDDPDCELAIYASGDWRGWRSKAAQKEPWTFDWLKEIGTGVLYDVGACVGSYSLMAAARGATVIAFEPVPWNYSECVANVCFNRLRNVTVLPVAVGAEDGIAEIQHPAGPVPGFGEGGRATQPQPTWTLRIPQVALANLDPYPRPTHIKIDVEGGEVKVLHGADLTTVQSLIVEVRDDDAETDVMAIMQGRGFESTWNGGRRTEKQRTHIFRRVA